MLNSEKLQKAFWWIFVVYAFTFSWNLTFSSFLLAGMILLWIAGFGIKGQNDFKRFLKDSRAWVLLGPYLVSVIGLSYSSDFDHGLFILGVAFCAFAQPIIFSSSNWTFITQKQIGYVLFAFVLGSLTASIFCLTYSTINYLGGSQLGFDEFYYVHLMKLPLSPGAFGNYLNVSILVLLLFITKEFPYYQRNTKWQLMFAIALLVFFVWFLFMLQAKGSILAFIVALVLLFLFKLSKRYSKRLIGIIVAFGIAGGVLFFQFGGLSLLGKRFEEIPKVLTTISKTSETSTTLRLSAIYGSIDIIKKNPVFGVGTGAVKNELTKFYKREGYKGALKHKTDCHNQFLRSFAKNGIFGFLAVLFAVLLPIIMGIRRSSILLILVGSTQFLMALTGDIFDNQPGIVFHSFVLGFLIFVAEPIRGEQNSI